jgi:uncharacterized damage-inducible protein DinB
MGAGTVHPYQPADRGDNRDGHPIDFRAVTGSLLDDAFQHHVWATLQLIDACAPLTADQLDTAVPGTYGSIIDTMRHLVGADASYLSVLTHGTSPQIDESTLDLAGLRRVMEEHGVAWASLLSGNLDPDENVVRRRDDGSESHASVGIRLSQAIHHGTDHRSQICTALTSLDVEPPEIDVWAYAWQDDRLREVPPPHE